MTGSSHYRDKLLLWCWYLLGLFASISSFIWLVSYVWKYDEKYSQLQNMRNLK